MKGVEEHVTLFIVKGKLFLIVGPSGVGKGTAINGIKIKHPEFVFPVSATTRKRRPHEKDGDVYYFLSKEEFKKKIKNDEFLEWAIVHEDNYYGTLKKEIIDNLKKGKVVVRELDIQGFESVIKKMPAEHVVSIFIIPPNIETLKSRILHRSKMSEKELAKRMESAENELAKAEECEYKVISTEGKVEKLIGDVEGIILKEMK